MLRAKKPDLVMRFVWTTDVSAIRHPPWQTQTASNAAPFGELALQDLLCFLLTYSIRIRQWFRVAFNVQSAMREVRTAHKISYFTLMWRYCWGSVPHRDISPYPTPVHVTARVPRIAMVSHFAGRWRCRHILIFILLVPLLIAAILQFIHEQES